MNKLSKLFSSSVKKVLACGSEMNISTVNRFWVYLVLFKIMKETAYFLKNFLVDPIPKKSYWNISGYIVGETDVGRQINFIFHFSCIVGSDAFICVEVLKYISGKHVLACFGLVRCLSLWMMMKDIVFLP